MRGERRRAFAATRHIVPGPDRAREPVAVSAESQQPTTRS
jgi:hypothetical protein